jgi:DHHC palmitoyltransferase
VLFECKAQSSSRDCVPIPITAVVLLLAGLFLCDFLITSCSPFRSYWRMGKCGSRYPPGKERYLDGRFVVSPHRIGNSYLLYGVKDSHFPFHCFVGPEWPCMLVTYSLIIVPTIFFLVNVATLWSSSSVLAIGILTFLAVLLAFSSTACTEPGIIFLPTLQTTSSLNAEKIELGQSSSSGEKIECAVCNVERPQTASHCYECGVCVDQLDHHCPWYAPSDQSDLR